MYQCFFTLPSVRVGNVLSHRVFSMRNTPQIPLSKFEQTFAISLQVLPASRMVLSLCSSSAVHGVLVRPFFFPGAVSGVLDTGGGAFASPSTGPPNVGGGMVPIGPGCCWSDARRFRGFGGALGAGGGGGPCPEGGVGCGPVGAGAGTMEGGSNWPGPAGNGGPAWVKGCVGGGLAGTPVLIRLEAVGGL